MMENVDASGFRGRRQAVAGESYNPEDPAEQERAVVNYPKSAQQLECIRKAASEIILFKKCDVEQLDVLFAAMFERKVKRDEMIIRQHDDGDNFYIIERGTYEIIIKSERSEKVLTISDGFFGELALLYNCPRNATVIAKNDGILWGLDQHTFRQIVVKAAAQKRHHFEECLKSVSMLESLTEYELTNLTDALYVEHFDTNAAIIKQGDLGTKMYFLMEGEVSVKITNDQTQQETEIRRLLKGSYFGELALLTRQPRAASVYSTVDNTKCAVLKIRAFERLLGPCVDIMKRNFAKYEEERIKLGITSL